MKLKSGCIFWSQVYDGPLPRTAPLAKNVRCDVAIIGAGISGALAAYHLTRAGVSTVMLDRRAPAQGSTAASTGLLQYEIDTPLIDLIARHGRDKATLAYRASVEAVEAFGPLVATLDEPCGLIARPSLYLASTKNDVARLRAEQTARSKMGIEVNFLSAAQLRQSLGVERPAALGSPLAWEVDPYRLTLALIRAALQRGLALYTPTTVTHCQAARRGMTLHTKHGARVHAAKVVFATGYETMEFLPADLCRLASTYAVVSHPLAHILQWPQRCLIWEAARPYVYMRTTADGRAMIGGEDVDIVAPKARDRLLPQKTRKLCQRLGSLLPGMHMDVACAWAGTFAQTPDGLPYIGSVKHLPHAYFALGYGGNGITFSLLAAHILTDAVLGRPNAHAELFAFDR